MEFLETVLFPLIYALKIVLQGFYGLTGNYGVSILLLSGFVALIIWPLSRYSQRVEHRDKLLHDAMASKLAVAKREFKGEAQFNEIEKIYKEHNYHPIKSLKSLVGIAVQLPFLIACLLLLIDFPPLAGTSFLVLNDLSQPDGLLAVGDYSINLLPLLMSGITLWETAIKPDMTREGRIKFTFVTTVILLLIYGLPSAVVLYWTGNNIISLTRTLTGLR